MLPEGGAHRLDLVSDTHGTMAHRDYAPSPTEDSGRYAAYLHASAGRAVAAPDYLGLGKGPGIQPYMDTGSAVTASLDMLRASRTAALRLGPHAENPGRVAVGVFGHTRTESGPAQYQLLACQNDQAPHGLP